MSGVRISREVRISGEVQMRAFILHNNGHVFVLEVLVVEDIVVSLHQLQPSNIPILSGLVFAHLLL